MGLSNRELREFSEEWVPIVDFPNYAVSNTGEVLSRVRDTLLAQSLNTSTGYIHVCLWKNGKGYVRTVHRLVALHFLDLPYETVEVNHKDGNKTNNHVSNLEWLTRSENHRHAYRTGIREPVRNGERQILCVQTGDVFRSIAEAGRVLGVRPSTISNCLAGRRRSCQGLTFEYA